MVCTSKYLVTAELASFGTPYYLQRKLCIRLRLLITIHLKCLELPSMVFASRIAKMVRQDLDPQMDWKTSSNYPLQSKQIHDLLQVG